LDIHSWQIIEIDTTNNGNEIASALAKALVVEPGKEAPLPKLRSLNLSGSVDIYTVASQVGVRGTKVRSPSLSLSSIFMSDKPIMRRLYCLCRKESSL
jgi:hypothetical protein